MAVYVNKTRPSIRPTLLLDFAKSKSVDERLTFTRASSASYYNSEGIMKYVTNDQPRIDFDPSTGECRGLLIEVQSTNKTLYSNEFDNSYWQVDNYGTLVPNLGLAPDNTMSADFLKEYTGSTAPRLIRSTYWSDLGGTTFTFSIHVKSVGSKRNVFMLCQDSSNAFYGHFDIVAGTVVQASTNGTGTLVGSGIENKGNGWYRIWITGSISSSNIYSMIHLEAANSTGFGATSYTGDGASGAYVWGAQIETRSFPTSYITTAPTFTSRASSATYFDSSGTLRIAGINQARYGYVYDTKSSTWISSGLVVESSATNLLTYSDQFEVGAWGIYNGSVSANVYTSPDGNSTADKVIPNTSNTGHGVSHTVTLSNGTVYTASVYAKSAGGYNIYITFGDSPYISSQFDLNTGTIVSNAASVIASSMISIGNGWYRCSVTIQAGTHNKVYIECTNASNINGFAGDGSTGVYLWGAQVEANYYPTSYIPTVDSTVTRSADVSSSSATTRASETARINNFENLNPKEGSIEFQVSTVGIVENVIAIAIDDGSTSNRIVARNLQTPITTDAYLYTYISGSVYTLSAGSQMPVNNILMKGSFAYKDGDNAISFNGGAAATSSYALPPGLKSISVGGSTLGSFWNGHIKHVTYYSKRISNAELQQLTL